MSHGGHAAGEPAAGPSYSGTVVLELGAGAGALVLQVPAGLDGAEIEISQDGNVGSARTHSMVRPRHVSGGTIYAAVYPDLAPGSYVVRAGTDAPGPTVAVTAGAVTTAELSAAGLSVPRR